MNTDKGSGGKFARADNVTNYSSIQGNTKYYVLTIQRPTVARVAQTET